MLLAVVTNSKSGSSVDGDHLARLMERSGHRVELLTIDELATGLPAGVQRVVVAGGDGSLGTAARAAHRAGAQLAVIPAGTANDFVRALELPLDIDQAAAIAADGQRTRRIELGLFGEHPFLNAASAGLSAVASGYAEPLKPRLGPLAYPVGALRAGLAAQPLRATVDCDGTRAFDGEAWQVVVAVTGAFGGGSGIGDARPDDGRLDVAVVPAGARIGLLRRAWGMRRAALTAQPDVMHHRGKEVHVQLPDGSEYNVDGDRQPAGDGRFSLLAGGVDVVVK